MWIVKENTEYTEQMYRAKQSEMSLLTARQETAFIPHFPNEV